MLDFELWKTGYHTGYKSYHCTSLAFTWSCEFGKAPYADSSPRKGQCLSLAGIDELKQMVESLTTARMVQTAPVQPLVAVPATKRTRTTKRILQSKPMSLKTTGLHGACATVLYRRSKGRTGISASQCRSRSRSHASSVDMCS